MRLARVHAVTDSRIATIPDLLERASGLVAEGATLHARGRDLTGRVHWDLAQSFKALASTQCFVNDRVDITVALGCPGIVLGTHSLPISPVRDLVGAACLIGRSVHSLGEGQAAADDGADFLIAGAVFPTATHPHDKPLGLPGLASIVAVGLPVIAIGGITFHNAAAVRDEGVTGIAAIRALWDAPNPGEAARALREILDAGSNQR